MHDSRDATGEGNQEGPARAQDVAALAQALAALTQRVGRLEGAARPVEASVPPRAVTPMPAPESAALAPAAADAATTADATNADAERELEEQVAAYEQRFQAPARAASGRAAWQVGPLRNVAKESLPVVAMGAAGGIALLMGLLYFTWYSIQQGWVPPQVRLGATALFGVAALAQAWRMAPRGQATVAAALGGAGLGGIFGATLVARHVHDYFSSGTTFALLVLAAAVGLLIAAHRNLRILALLAAFGAVITPLVIGADTSAVNELMAYQLVVVGFLYVLEDRRKWPELGHMAVASTWLLMVAAAQSQSLTGCGPWAWVYLVVGHGQAWNLLRRGRLGAIQAAPRFWINGFLAWTIAGKAAASVSGDEVAAYTSLGMALLNAGLARALWLSTVAASPELTRGRLMAIRAGFAGCVSLAWLQLFASAPLYFGVEETGTLLVWTAMATAAAVLHVRKPRVATAVPILMPYLAAVIWSAVQGGALSAGFGFFLAALPIGMGLWPDRAALARASVARESYLALLLSFGCIVWLIISFNHLTRAVDTVPFRELPYEGWIAVGCLFPATAIVLRSIGASSRVRVNTALVLLLAFVALCVLFALAVPLFDPRSGLGVQRAWQMGALGGVTLLTFLLGYSFKERMLAEPGEAWLARVFDHAGLLVPLALLIVAMLAVAGVVPTLTDDPANASSLNQAGWSLCWAIAGLTLLLRGLFKRRAAWRRAGMFALFATAAKLVVVDLVAVSMMWRVMSFAGLGCCLLLGAYAYRRLGIWVERGTTDDS